MNVNTARWLYYTVMNTSSHTFMTKSCVQSGRTLMISQNFTLCNAPLGYACCIPVTNQYTTSTNPCEFFVGSSVRYEL